MFAGGGDELKSQDPFPKTESLCHRNTRLQLVAKFECVSSCRGPLSRTADREKHRSGRKLNDGPTGIVQKGAIYGAVLVSWSQIPGAR